MAVAIQAQLKDEDPERSRLANQRSIRALGIVATPPALNYDPRLLERVDDFAVERSKVQTAGTAEARQFRPMGACARNLFYDHSFAGRLAELFELEFWILVEGGYLITPKRFKATLATLANRRMILNRASRISSFVRISVTRADGNYRAGQAIGSA
jgi:hypothetical protein